MGGKMPIEKLRDRLRELSMRDEAVTNTPDTLAHWADIVDAHLTQPAQAVDVGAIREVIAWLRRQEGIRVDPDHVAESLTAALPNAQAVDGWQPTDDDVRAWRGRHNVSLSLYDCRSAIEDARIMHHFDVRPAALPNANGKEG